MIKICSESLTARLRIMFEQSLKEARFLEIWKKANIVLVHRKEDKNLLKNYCPISLLPIFSKIFERVIYNSLFNHFQSNKLFTSSQSGFLTGDSCIAQLLSIKHENKQHLITIPVSLQVFSLVTHVLPNYSQLNMKTNSM